MWIYMNIEEMLPLIIEPLAKSIRLWECKNQVESNWELPDIQNGC